MRSTKNTMNLILVIIIMMVSACSASLEDQAEETQMVKDEKVFTKVDQKPEFKGGYTTFIAAVMKHIEYPKSASEEGIEGKVFVSFIVEKDGSVGEVSLEKSSGNAALDEAAITGVQKAPKLIPGEHQGKKVRVKMVLPVDFKL